jgi:hypothetical protein
MLRHGFIASVIVLGLSFAPSVALADDTPPDTVFLKDGERLRGEVMEDVTYVLPAFWRSTPPAKTNEHNGNE